MFCSYCGNELEENSRFCSGCGHKIEQSSTSTQQNANSSQVNNNQSNNPVYNANNQPQSVVVDNGSIAWAFLGFFIPLVGLILYCVWKTERPKSSKMAGIGALISVSVSLFFTIIFVIIVFTVPEIWQGVDTMFLSL